MFDWKIFAFLILFTPFIFSIIINPINNCSELQDIKNNLGGDYKLENDINCSSFSFSPIGINTEAFVGILDGKGFMIHDLNIISSESQEGGIFGFTDSNAKIFNLTLRDITLNLGVTGSIGLLVGYAKTSIIKDIKIISSNKTVVNHLKSTKNSNAGAGGLIGYSDNSNITNIYISNTFVETPGYSRVGGVIGNINNG